MAYGALMLAFDLGVWLSAGQKRALRVTALALVGKEVTGFVATVFTPMHMRGDAGTLTDPAHGILTYVGIVCFLLAIAFGGVACGPRFCFYSIATMAVLIVFGVLAGLDIPQLSANLPTPWLGVYERINAFGYMLWVALLAIVLLRSRRHTARRTL